jgi:hypothetical protein
MYDHRSERNRRLGVPDWRDDKLDDREDPTQWKVVRVVACVVLVRMCTAAYSFRLHGDVVMSMICENFADVRAAVGMAMLSLTMRGRRRIHKLYAEYEKNQDGRDEAMMCAVLIQSLSQQSGSATHVN